MCPVEWWDMLYLCAKIFVDCNLARVIIDWKSLDDQFMLFVGPVMTFI